MIMRIELFDCIQGGGRMVRWRAFVHGRLMHHHRQDVNQALAQPPRLQRQHLAKNGRDAIRHSVDYGRTNPNYGLTAKRIQLTWTHMLSEDSLSDQKLPSRHSPVTDPPFLRWKNYTDLLNYLPGPLSWQKGWDHVELAG